VSKEPPEKAPQQTGTTTSDEQSASSSSSAPTHPTPLAHAPPQATPLQAATPSLPATAAAGTDVPDVGVNPPIQPSKIAFPSAAQLLHETIDIYEGGKQTKDYHGMFDSKYYIAWMRKLLSSLAKRGLKNMVIVMDNAKYHKTLPDSDLHKSWKKDRLQQACTARGIPFEHMDTKAILWDKLQKDIGATSKPTIVAMAEDAGHAVLFTPPRYSDLQPIEMVWGIVKNRIGASVHSRNIFQGRSMLVSVRSLRPSHSRSWRAASRRPLLASRSCTNSSQRKTRKTKRVQTRARQTLMGAMNCQKM
jgi:transposase